MTTIPKHKKDRPSVGADRPVKPQNYIAENVEGTSHSSADHAQNPHHSIDPDFFAQGLQGIHIVVAEIKSDDGRRFRRRFYASLDSAQKAVDRSRMNGREAYLYLGQITIVDGDHLD